MMRAGDSDAASDVAVGNGQDKRMVPNNFIEFLYLFGHFVSSICFVLCYLGTLLMTSLLCAWISLGTCL